jgi:acyl-CoA reductase-like NAD-dependent aldehyde dehydrogenase
MPIILSVFIAGAKLLCGGLPTDAKLRSGFFIEPVVFDNVEPRMTVWYGVNIYAL